MFPSVAFMTYTLVVGLTKISFGLRYEENFFSFKVTELLFIKYDVFSTVEQISSLMQTKFFIRFGS